MRRDEILRALAALGADLAERGLVADLYVVGGAAIALAYDERRATRDEVLDLVEQVGHPRLLTPQVELFVRSVMDGKDLGQPG